MDGSIRIGSIFGIPVGIHYTWFAVFLLVTVNLVFFFGGEAAYPEWGLFERIVVAVITSLLFFVSVLVHELAHSVVAMSNGIPVKSVTLFIFWRRCPDYTRGLPPRRRGLHSHRRPAHEPGALRGLLRHLLHSGANV